MKTFAVSPVQPATKVLDRSVAALKTIFSTNLESHSLSEEAIVSPQHNFIAMLNKAYDLHYPVVLSPDHIWLLISQSLAAHVNKNSSKLRSKFVAFEGRQTISHCELHTPQPSSEISQVDLIFRVGFEISLLTIRMEIRMMQLGD